ncbi:MAG: HAD family phosphatase [Lachnospiraceae bacterium]|nr:HAD family phosphatase [Lachnospiraceae bacterium]
MSIEAVIFDMDGVLFDTEKLCMDSWIAIAGERNIPDMEVFFPRCIGRNLTDTRMLFGEFYGELYDYEEFRKQASAWFHDYIEKNGMPMKKGVKELLEYLQRGGYKIGLASSTSRHSVEDHLERAGIRGYFQSLTTGDMVEHSKPQPDIYLMACKSLEVNPAQTMAIEDSPNGIRAAHAAGMIPVMVPDLIAPDQEMREKSSLICHDLLEVMRFFEK